MTDGDAAAGLGAARVSLRQAGYCVVCDRIVERVPDGSCPQGHPAPGVTGHVLLDDGEPVPSLPRFNLAAFLLPMIWGPAHGQWAGVVFLPLWLFADSIVRSSASFGPVARVASWLVVAVTVAMAAFFAKRANGLAWRRTWERVSVERFAARQRVWAAVAVPVFAFLLGGALYFDLIVLPARGL